MGTEDSGRRNFMKKSAVTAAGFVIVPRYVLGGPGFVAPSDQLNIAGIGVGGRGASVLNQMKGSETNIVALCDVDQNRAAKTFETFSKATRYKDFREMLDKEKDIDAVTIATPDHIHAVAAISAMQLGKHVYVEKPLAHSVHEVRTMTEAAQKYKVVSQMGNQGASGDGTWQIKNWIDKGLIGEVTKVHCWTNRPIWPQGIATPSGSNTVPDTLDWDLWLGPAPYRDYSPAYLPFRWRGWWDFGTGALGDMACHIVDPVFRALKLESPTAVEASVVSVFTGDFVEADFSDSCPPASKVVFDYPQRGDGYPALKLIWYDGGILPDRPDELGPDDAMGSFDGGVIFEGTEGKIMCEVYGENPTLLPKSRMKEVNPEMVKSPYTEGHYKSWITACKGGPKPASDFEIAGPLTEMILMGNLAIRSNQMKVLKPGKKPGDWDPYNYPGKRKLMWDGNNMKITNFDEANQFVRRTYRDGWAVGDL